MKEQEKFSSFQEDIQKKNPQLALFKVIEEVLGEKLKPFIVDMTFEKNIVWIIVSHPCVTQLLFLKKTAIMSKLRVFSSSLLVKDVRFKGLSYPSPSFTQGFSHNSPFVFAPTGEVQGEVVEIENVRLKELLEILSSRTGEQEEKS